LFLFSAPPSERDAKRYFPILSPTRICSNNFYNLALFPTHAFAVPHFPYAQVDYNKRGLQHKLLLLKIKHSLYEFRGCGGYGQSGGKVVSRAICICKEGVELRGFFDQETGFLVIFL
jgi:hypothetical protein